MSSNTQTWEAKRILSKAARARKKLQRALESGKCPWSKIDGLEKTLRRYDAEALALIDQAANNNDLPQLFGGSDPRALAVMSTSTDHVLMGEEMYAAKAYLRAQLPHLASLRAADVVRIVIAVMIVIAFVSGLLSK